MYMLVQASRHISFDKILWLKNTETIHLNQNLSASGSLSGPALWSVLPQPLRVTLRSPMSSWCWGCSLPPRAKCSLVLNVKQTVTESVTP